MLWVCTRMCVRERCVRVCLCVFFFISVNHKRIDSFLEHIHLSTAGFIKRCLHLRPDHQVTLFLWLHTKTQLFISAPVLNVSTGAGVNCFWDFSFFSFIFFLKLGHKTVKRTICSNWGETTGNTAWQWNMRWVWS